MNVCIGQIVGVHGIKGLVKVKPFLQEISLFKQFNSFTDEQNSQIKSFKIKGFHAGTFLVEVNQIKCREEAQLLLGKKIFVKEEDFPQLKTGEFYQRDLIGLKVLKEGKIVGFIKSVENYGAGDILNIEKTDGSLELIGFTEENFPKVNLSNQTIEMGNIIMREECHES